MANSKLGWVGKAVRHPDGRSGVIRSEYIGFGFAGLTIACEGGASAYVQLNTSGEDDGEPGWQWWCENFSDGPCWLDLGAPLAPELADEAPGMRGP